MLHIRPDAEGKNNTYHECSFISQNVRGLRKDNKIEGIVEHVIKNNVDVFLLQESWLVGNKIHHLTEHVIFYYGLNKELSRKGERRVVITLSPRFTEFYENSGWSPQKMLSHYGEDVQRKMHRKHIKNEMHFQRN